MQGVRSSSLRVPTRLKSSASPCGPWLHAPFYSYPFNTSPYFEAAISERPFLHTSSVGGHPLVTQTWLHTRFTVSTAPFLITHAGKASVAMGNIAMCLGSCMIAALIMMRVLLCAT